MNKAASFVENLCIVVSLGKYRTPLYHSKKDYYATVFSGIVTVICYAILCFYSISVLRQIFQRQSMNFDTTALPLEYIKNNSASYLPYCDEGNVCQKFTSLDFLDSFVKETSFIVWVSVLTG